MKRHHYGYLEGITSAIVNIILFSLKIWVGLATGSIAMITDAWHTLSDSVSSGLVLVGFWISAKPKDKEHPFGHGRAEQISAIVIGTILALASFQFLYDAINSFKATNSVTYGKSIIIVSIITIIIKETLAQFAIWSGKKINSQALIADAWHHRSDAATSLLILIGAILGRYFWWVDAILGVLISLAILYTAYEIITSASNSILGESISQDFTNQIITTITESAPETSDIHHIHVHKYGEHSELTLHLKLPGELSVYESHTIANKVEADLEKKFNMHSTIHIEPK
jgi:cation diffusion facilitator family transporter